MGVLVSAALIFVSARSAHLIGYALGAFFVAIAIVVFRTVDRRRQRSNLYVGTANIDRVAVALLVAGIVMGIANAYLGLTKVTLA